MAEIINLKQARKRRDRASDKARAVTNRVVHGMPKAERERAAREAAEAARRLDAHRRED